MSTALQMNLVRLGYGDIVGKIDGINGKKTKDGVKKFQENRRLIIDGIAGKQTNKEIEYMKKNAGFLGTRNFSINEFRCPDKNSLPTGGMDRELILDLELLRWKLGNKSVRVNSGYRTPAFNKRIGGIADSNHLTGKAADIKVIGVSASEVHKMALDIFSGVGKYKNFTHVDTFIDSRTGKGQRYTGGY